MVTCSSLQVHRRLRNTRMLKIFNSRRIMEQNPFKNATKSANLLTWSDKKRLQFVARSNFSQAYDELQI